MAEYIERETLRKEIEKAQTSLESNDDKVWNRNKPYFKGLAWANRLILDAPAADVVEVVRCKDCKYWDGEGRCEGIRNGLILEYTDRLDYCSYGERKDGAE